MSADDENLTAEEKYKQLVDAETAAKATPFRGRPSVKIGPTEAINIADQAVKPVRLQTKLQWGALGAMVIAVGGFIVWSLGFLTTVSSAQAQTSAKQDATASQVVLMSQRIEAIDAGSRAAMERLERKIDANEEHAQRERDEQRAMLQAVLREVKKK